MQIIPNLLINAPIAILLITKTKSELPIFIDYVNTKAARGNDNMYLDLNNDGYINAKDYALLNKISN